MTTSLDRFLANHPALNRAGSQELTIAVWGGIAQEFDAMKAETNKLTRDAVNVRNLFGDELDEVIARFVGIDRMRGEPDSLRLSLLDAFFLRKEVPSWATVHSIRKVFRYWFADEYINIREGEVETNLVADGDFESFDAGTKTGAFGNWTPYGTSISIEMVDTFEGSRVLHGINDARASFTKAVTAGTYMLSFAYKGDMPVAVRRMSDNYYWNFSTRVWQSTFVNRVLPTTTQYSIIEEPIIAAGSHNVQVVFGHSGGTHDWKLDYVSFGVKPAYPYLHIIVSTFGQGGSFLNNWPAGTDPIAGTSYTNATFFGLDYLGGEGSGIPTEYYQRILNYIKPAGTKAVFEFLGRD